MAAQQTGGGGEEDPVGVSQLRPSHLSAQDGQFVAEHHDLEVLGGTAPELERRKHKHASDEKIENGGKHATELSRHRRAAASRDRGLRNTSSMSWIGFWHPTPRRPPPVVGRSRRSRRDVESKFAGVRRRSAGDLDGPSHRHGVGQLMVVSVCRSRG